MDQSQQLRDRSPGTTAQPRDQSPNTPNIAWRSSYAQSREKEIADN